jgi:phosphoesterase RecJ-like protein
MPGQENILIYDNEKLLCDELFQSANVLFSLDYNAPSRIGDASEAFVKSNATKVLIDHHINPESEVYNFCYSKTDITSTSELVYELMDYLAANLIDKSIAECIYTGIMTDTGSFSYNCNYVRTFEIVAELYKTGIDGQRINRLIYANNTESRLRLLGFSLSQKLKVITEYHTAYIYLSKQDLLSYNYKDGDTEGLVNYALSIEGIRFAALFSEREDKIRVSFRSVGEFSVNRFARAHFEGGGHRNAAGGDSFIDMDKTLEKFERLLAKYTSELK